MILFIYNLKFNIIQQNLINKLNLSTKVKKKENNNT